MPARLLSMELSDPATPATTNAPNRRKSARTVQKPISYQQDSNVSIGSTGSAKRKRGDTTSVDIDADPLGDETSSDNIESDPDEEELKEQRRRALKVKRVRNKPATKKLKTERLAITSLAMRPATNGVKKLSKPRKSSAKQNTTDPDETGLYGQYHKSSDSYQNVCC